MVLVSWIWGLFLLGLGENAVAYDDDGAVVTADYVVDPVAEKSAVVQASYSTGSAGSKLTWRPYRPSPNTRVLSQAPAQAEQPASYNEAVAGRTSPNNPFDDPFDDASQLTQLVPPANLRDDLLEKPEPKPIPMPTGKLPTQVSQQLTPKAESTQESQEIIGGKELEKALASGPQAGAFVCPSPKDLKPIHKISYRITPEKGELPQECGLGGDEFQPRVWEPITFTWKASALCHKPLYFEQVALERYGHTVGLGLQPAVSAAHFFLTVPILPYKMGLYPPNECMYTLGYYRPGSCAPYLLDPLPISVRAALFEGAAVTAGVLVLP